MSDRIAIQPTGALRGSIRLPGSKSITNRALVCASLAEGISTLRGALDSEDTRVLAEGLNRLGIRVEADATRAELTVYGCSGRIPGNSGDLFVANSGTTIRFLTAMLTLGRGTFRLDGIPRMRQRPIGDLLAALKQLGADCRGEIAAGFPPVVIAANGLKGGRAAIRGDISSQFLSALLMAAPLAESDVELSVEGTLVSKPYVDMTLRVMDSFGVNINASDLSHFKIPSKQTYRACDYAIEPDASAASYFWGAAAVTGGEVTVEGLTSGALQGDVKFVECLEQMGCRVACSSDRITVIGGSLRGIDVNMNAISDTVQTLAVVALFASSPTTIRGVAHIRHKETDRIGDLARELRKLGANVAELADGLRIEPPAQPRGAEIATYNDHRMAMSLAIAGLRIPGVVILDPACTAKTYPRFFEDLSALGRT